MEDEMLGGTAKLCSAMLFIACAFSAPPPATTDSEIGVLRVHSVYSIQDTIAGLDWPVRLLVRQDESGAVWLAYTDFAWIAHRFRVKDSGAQFQMASMAIASITSSVAAKVPNPDP
jgi:hypothetical protein